MTGNVYMCVAWSQLIGLRGPSLLALKSPRPGSRPILVALSMPLASLIPMDLVGLPMSPDLWHRLVLGLSVLPFAPPALPPSLSMISLALVVVSLPGRQTVPRAELWGAIQTLSCASPGLCVDLGIDASYVTNGPNHRGALPEARMETGYS